MLPQEELIQRVRELCHDDVRLVAALTYGSFAQGAGDAYSDVEFWLFFDPESRAALDEERWLAGIAPFRYAVVNEFGSHVVFFPGLVRGEFHFATSDDIASVGTWPALSAPVDQMIVVDHTGALRRALEMLREQPSLPTTGAEINALCGRFANWLVLAHHVARRGELLRAVDALTHVHRHLLWMARLVEGRTGSWLTPSRRAESDLSAQVISSITAATTSADAAAVAKAIAAAWTCGRDLWERLAEDVPAGLFADLDAAVQR
ncbi:MAG: hypothetical protein HOU81_27385 [Hamadaea sp.]|uniref:hypothetical protein n=1 Tax=Hamadaea sp. TaxID=2024425 RepID=UPI0018166FCA|nr:hypothetical protein [Hamadaea sp.]NUR74550.1 hypothetical protein [Hamadaea sp.]NUT20802.1 hypothetical protein [Hamadaea sp.]